MKTHPRRLAHVFALACLTLSLPAARAQVGGGHTLFGDLKVDERNMDKLASKTYYVILNRVGGNIGHRQPVPNNGRYRFLNVANGDYELAVETDGQEVARIPIRLSERLATDIRRDLYLEWKAQFSPRKEPVRRASVKDFYNRPAENKGRFRSALEKSEKGEQAAALRLLEQIVASDPGDFEAWTELGTLHFKQGSTATAESAYKRALEIRPTFGLALLNLGKLYLAEGNLDRSVQTLERCVSVQGWVADAHLFLGEAYLRLKKGSKAVVHFNEALRLEPVGMAEAHLRLAALYDAAHMKDRAAAEYEQFLAKQPEHRDRKKLDQYIRANK